MTPTLIGHRARANHAEADFAVKSRPREQPYDQSTCGNPYYRPGSVSRGHRVGAACVGPRAISQLRRLLLRERQHEGRYFCIRDGERVTEMPHGMNGLISRFVCSATPRVSVWRDHSRRPLGAIRHEPATSRQRCGTIRSRRSRCIRRAGATAIEGERERLEWGHAPQPREGACFYEDNSFKGRYFCVQRGGEYAALGGEFNRAIRSIRVFNGAEVIFLDRDFRGRNVNVRHDVADLHGVWRDNIESVRFGGKDQKGSGIGIPADGTSRSPTFVGRPFLCPPARTGRVESPRVFV